MELQPNEPPGHAKRKLRGLVGEIKRLRTEGYTIRAIHETLQQAGVKVSWATVQREAARLSQHPANKQGKAGSEIPPTVAPEPPQKHGPATVDLDAYFASHNTNPLLKRKKGTP